MINFLKSFFTQPVTLPLGEGKSKTMPTGIFLLICFVLLFWVLYVFKIRIPIPKFLKRKIRRRKTRRYAMNRTRRGLPKQRYSRRYNRRTRR